MANHQGHSHANHHHGPSGHFINGAFIAGIILNLLFVIIEFLAGWYNHSMALISDAGHNLVDVISLVLAMMAFRMAQIKSTQTLTYGYSKTTVLASLINAVILFVAIGGIAWESYHRLLEPREIHGNITIIVASVGILINGITAFLFFRNKEADLNIKGAYLHLVADALVSLGVVVAGIIIVFTGWYLIDTIMSFVIILVIFFSTWTLFKDSLILTIDGVPRHLDVNEIITQVKKIEGVQDLHHVHVWAISTTINALTAHVVIPAETSIERIVMLKNQIRQEIRDKGIQHITLEMETAREDCHDPVC